MKKNIVNTLVRKGLDAEVVSVEVDHYRSHPGTVIVGLGDKAVMESKERIRAALKNSEISYPRGRVVINLAPADLIKGGSHFDLPIAVALFFLQNGLSTDDYSDALFIGELALNGEVRSTSEIFSLVYNAASLGFKRVFLASENALEASCIPDIELYPVSTISALRSHLLDESQITPLAHQSPSNQQHSPKGQFLLQDIVGQHHAKRALLIAAAGGHNLLFCGPPGSGKSLLSRTLPSLLPPLEHDELLDVARIYAASSLVSDQYLSRQRPFRAVHHSASPVSLVGGGSIPRPGEISLAHRGVLFLDELPEFPRSTLEVLRQPFEDRTVRISRSHGTYEFPSDFLCCAAMNPCPCGYYGSRQAPERCRCGSSQIQRYQGRISGPLMDRFGLLCSVQPLPSQQIFSSQSSPPSFRLEDVIQARSFQIKRNPQQQLNGTLSFSVLQSLQEFSDDIRVLLQQITDRYAFSTRRLAHVLGIARTIADLQESSQIMKSHVLESVQYSRLSFLH